MQRAPPEGVVAAIDEKGILKLEFTQPVTMPADIKDLSSWYYREKESTDGVSTIDFRRDLQSIQESRNKERSISVEYEPSL